ncbi:hypothetical protein [Muricoccus radiodurans]|uniref:hypothetical protein n=1 Tax=Muricoccus radiodurans TaxID=2231721 RepID=UPI003CF430EC
MNDRWTDIAHSIVEDALAELLEVQARLATLPVHSARAAALRLRAGDLEHRVAAASRVLDAYAHAGAPGERDDEEGRGGMPLPCPAVSVGAVLPAREAA